MTINSAVALDLVGAALLEARAALAGGVVDLDDPYAQHDKAHEALLTLARASYDALAAWEQENESTRRPTAVATRAATWRVLLEDLRVQVVLAEMEVRDATQSARALAEQSMSAVEERFNDAAHDLGTLLAKLRSELAKVAR
jgi:hypothetical protein